MNAPVTPADVAARLGCDLAPDMPGWASRLIESPHYPVHYQIHWSPDGECVAEIVHGEATAEVMAAGLNLVAALVNLRARIKDAGGKTDEADAVLARIGWKEPRS